MGDIGCVVTSNHRVHRQHETTLEQQLRARQPRLETKIAELVHGLATPLRECPNTAALEILAESIAVRRLDFIVLKDVKMPGIASRCRREDQMREVMEGVVILSGNVASMGDDSVIIPQLQIQNCCLQVVQTRIDSPCFYISALVPSMIPQQVNAASNLVIIRYDRSTVTKAPEELGGIEAEYTRTTERTRVPTAKSRAERLRRILQDKEAMAVCNLLNSVHLGRSPIQLHRHDCACPLRNSDFYCIWIYQMVIAAIDWHWNTARMYDR